MGGKFHLKLNTDERPIANKYREGKMKRTLKRESKELEIVWRVTVFEQCGGGLLLGSARSRVCIPHIPSSCGFHLGKSVLEKVVPFGECYSSWMSCLGEIED